MKLLIADDDSISRRLLQRILTLEEGNEVVEAADGADAWALISGPDHKFDCVFLDLQMPSMGGLDVVKQMRQSDALRHVPVILCTSSNDRPTVVKAATAGVRHYIVKPPDAIVVLTKLKLATQEAQAAADAASPSTTASTTVQTAPAMAGAAPAEKP